MRILVVSSWFPSPPSNGSKLRAFHLMTQLASRGHRITLLSFAEAGELRRADDLRAMCEAVELVEGNPHKAGAVLPSLRLFGRMPRSYATTYSSTMASLVANRWRDHDLLLALQIGAALYLDPKMTLPTVFEEAEVGVVRDRYMNESRPLRRARHGLTWWKYGSFIRSLARIADRTTTVSSVERQHLIDAGCNGERIDEVPNGVDDSHLQVPAASVERGAPLIYPGAITYQANLDAVRHFTTDILPRVRATNPDVHLQVTGDTGAVDTREFSGPVTFTGQVAAVAPLLRAARLCIVPLRVGGGTRLKALEAMAMGTPVVSTSKGIEGLALTPEHDVLIGDDPETFARQVARLLDDDMLRARLSANGRQTIASRYTWTLVGDALEQSLTRALHERGRRTTVMAGSEKGSDRGAP